VSFALILGPYWAFGFGLGDWVRRKLENRGARILGILLLITPYLVFSIPRGDLHAGFCFGFAAVLLCVAALLGFARPEEPGWADAFALAILALAVELRYFNSAFGVPGLSGLAKLTFVNAGLYGYLVVRPLSGMGFDFRPQARDFTIGLREFAFFAPVALALGFATGFLHFHQTLPGPLVFGGGWLFTLFFIAVPEELFFRGLMLNMLARKVGAQRALLVTSVIFGLSHFNKRAQVFNWQYVLLATIAGIFYGRAWLDRRRILTSSVTHATVDTVWSVWFR